MNHASNKPKWHRPVAALGVFVLFAGMLFWTKLRLVSDIPRSAYAVPGEESAEPIAEPAADEDREPESEQDSETEPEFPDNEQD